jgi:hypothetical protein
MGYSKMEFAKKFHFARGRLIKWTHQPIFHLRLDTKTRLARALGFEIGNFNNELIRLHRAGGVA